jgi:hypothetical protein
VEVVMRETVAWRAAFACAALVVSACSAEDSGGSRPGGRIPPRSPGSPNGGTMSGTDPAGGGEFGNGNNMPPPDFNTVTDPNKAPGVTTTTIDSSFIWVANSAQGTVSKIDTRTMTELGRYLTSPNGTGLPSRTSVGGDGSVAVANRGNATGQLAGDGGGVARIFSDSTKCADKNGNGMIDTSTGANDVKPWMEDECLAWFTPINHFSNRPVAWAPAPGPDLPANPWTAATSMCDGPACTIEVFKLNGETGAIDGQVTISGLSGIDFITAGASDPSAGLLGLLGGLAILNYGAYGAASDGGGNLWLFVANTTQLVRVDAITLEHRTWPTPMGNGYGITIDDKGRIFICGALGVSRFDPSTEAWVDNFTAIDTGFNGCMSDGKGRVWVGGGSDGGAIGLLGFDAESMTLVDQVNMDDMGRPMNVKGVSVDVDGRIWGISSPGATMLGAGNVAWRFDPMTREVASYDGLNGAYSYSDMTGFGLSQAGTLVPPVL